MFCGGIARTLSLRSTRSHVAALDSTSSRLAFSRSTGSAGGCALRGVWQPTQYLLTNARYVFGSAAGTACPDGLRSRLRAVALALRGSRLRAVALALRGSRLRAVALALRGSRLRAVALALRGSRLRAVALALRGSRLRALALALRGPPTPSATVVAGAWDRAAVPACPSRTAAPAQAMAAVAMNFVIASPGLSYQ